MRYWTPNQARYTGRVVVTSTRPDDQHSPGLTLHYQLTVHGAVRRTYVGPDYVEVALHRHGNRHATFQGTVQATAGGWIAYDPDSNPLTPVFTDYLAAEAVLLPRRTRRRSSVAYVLPTEIAGSIR